MLQQLWEDFTIAGVGVYNLREVRSIRTIGGCLPSFVNFVLAPKFQHDVSHRATGGLGDTLSPGVGTINIFIGSSTRGVGSFIRDNVVSVIRLRNSRDPRFYTTVGTPMVGCFGYDNNIDRGVNGCGTSCLLFSSNANAKGTFS